MSRLFDDAFLLVARDAGDRPLMTQLSRTLAERLSRPMTLSTSAKPGDLEAGQMQWAAQVGVGLLVATSHANPSVAVATVSEMSRTACGYRSRVALYDDTSGEISELASTNTTPAVIQQASAPGML
jgi:hypothetical protein